MKPVKDITPAEFIGQITLFIPTSQGLPLRKREFIVTRLGRIAYAIDTHTGTNWTRHTFVEYFSALNCEFEAGHNNPELSND